MSALSLKSPFAAAVLAGILSAPVFSDSKASIDLPHTVACFPDQPGLDAIKARFKKVVEDYKDPRTEPFDSTTERDYATALAAHMSVLNRNGMLNLDIRRGPNSALAFPVAVTILVGLDRSSGDVSLKDQVTGLLSAKGVPSRAVLVQTNLRESVVSLDLITGNGQLYENIGCTQGSNVLNPADPVYIKTEERSKRPPVSFIGLLPWHDSGQMPFVKPPEAK